MPTRKQNNHLFVMSMSYIKFNSSRFNKNKYATIAITQFIKITIKKHKSVYGHTNYYKVEAWVEYNGRILYVKPKL
jgi:hypothetical protein